ncbi:MAG: hypothetical protein KC561_12645, partial [Myxococcales bacterium]|nr:hypothetical protein [Myxococcales bacterium]
TGAYWAGPIGTLNVDIQLPGRPVHHTESPFEVSIPEAELVRDGENYYVRATLSDFEPTEDLIIEGEYSLDPTEYLPGPCRRPEGLNSQELTECSAGILARHGMASEHIPSAWLTIPLGDETALWMNPEADPTQFSDEELAYQAQVEQLLTALRQTDQP